MIRVGILGAGFMGQTHGDAYKKIDNVDIAAVANRSRDKGIEFAENYDCEYIPEAERLIEKKDIDVIDICLPTYLHEKYALAAISENKHVIVEKPLTLTLEAADNILEAVNDSGSKLMLGQTLRFWPEYLKIKEIYDQGILGNMNVVYANRLAQLPNWNDWFRDEEKSGGGLFDLHLHDIDYVCYLFGKVESVYAIGKKMEGRGWNHVVSSLNFANGTKACVEAGYEMTENFPFTMKFRGVGEKGTIDFNFKAGFNLEERESAINDLILYQSEKEPDVLETDGRDAYLNELEYFMNCIENDREVKVITPQEGREILEVMHALKESLETGEIVILD